MPPVQINACIVQNGIHLKIKKLFWVICIGLNCVKCLRYHRPNTQIMNSSGGGSQHCARQFFRSGLLNVSTIIVVSSRGLAIIILPYRINDTQVVRQTSIHTQSICMIMARCRGLVLGKHLVSTHLESWLSSACAQVQTGDPP
jgi:hypothetical protein